MEKYIIMRKKNRELIPFLILNPVYQVYSLYVCETKPEAESLTAVNIENGLIEAVLVTGKPDLYVAAGYYLTAVNQESGSVLLDTIKNESDFYLNFPLYLEKAVQRTFPKAIRSTEMIYIYDESLEIQSPVQNNLPNETVTVRHLTRELFESLEVDSVFTTKVTAQGLAPFSRFYGVIVENKLAAIGEYELENSVTCGISQVYTLEEYRKRGYASQLIRRIAERIKENNKLPVYHFSGSNIASRKACEKASFKECIRFGYMEIE